MSANRFSAVFISCAVVTLLASCGGGGGGGYSTTSSTSSSYSADTLATTAVNSMGGTKAIVAALIANDHGYSTRQLADAISAGTLQANGDISGADPARSAPNVLRGYMAQYMSRSLSATAKHFTDSEVAALHTIVGIFVAVETRSEKDELKAIMMSMGSGFIADQIVAGIVGHTLKDSGQITGQTPNGVAETDVFTETGGGSTSGGGSSSNVSFPITYRGYANNTQRLSVSWGSAGSATCQSYDPVEITLNADGTLSVNYSYSKYATWNDAGTVWCENSTTSSVLTGTHSNGQFSINYPCDKTTGTYTSTGIQGTGSCEWTDSYAGGYLVRQSLGYSFNITTAQ
ncbi:MAG: hypothetical protein HQK86_05440 [Nitrospinae bacterium]|nr:hypothetical protein [Nitrospinota bacterium]